MSAASDVRTLLAAHPFTDGCSAAELESLARRQAELEDVELEVMERLEVVQNRLAALRGSL